MTDAIGIRWQAYIKPQLHSLTVGTARVTFHIDAHGGATDIKLVSNTSDAAFGKICIQAVDNALLPALTPEALAAAKNKPLEFTINFTFYAAPPE